MGPILGIVVLGFSVWLALKLLPVVFHLIVFVALVVLIIAILSSFIR